MLLAVGVVALADIGGYVAGNLFGKHKLAPVISPGKTWEGFFGGLFSQLLLVAILMFFLPVTVSPYNTYFYRLFPVSLILCARQIFLKVCSSAIRVLKTAARFFPVTVGVLTN
jgi:phosphatidate cytidylyltransferase